MATTLPTFKDLPQFVAADMGNPDGFTKKLQQVVETLQLIIGTRGPERGNPAWFSQLVAAGLLDPKGKPILKPPGSTDTTPPPTPTGLNVSPGINNIFIEWDPATYGQGGGNALTTIYGATYDPLSGDPLPTFGDAVPLATVPFSTQIYALPTAPNVEWHIWITFTTYAEKEGLPAGGTNGAVATSGKLNGAQHIEALTVTNALIDNLAVDDAKVANLSASKLITGTIAVGESISSSGFVSGVQGFTILGNGDTEFNNAIFRGTIYASAGQIGGALIASNYVQSSGYNGTTSGWRLDNALGKLFAMDAEIKGTITATAGVIGGWTIGATNLRLGATAYEAGTGLWMGLDGATPKVYFGSPTSYMKWNGTDLLLSKPLMDAFTASISGGNITADVYAYTSNSIATRTITPIGGRAPYTYLWLFAPTGIYIDATHGLPGELLVVGGIDAATVTLGGGAYFIGPVENPIHHYGRLLCIVTDSNGRNTVASVGVDVRFWGDGGDGGGSIGGGY